PLCGQMCPHYDGPLPTARLRGLLAGWKPALRVGQPRSSRSPACAGSTLARLETLLLLPNTVLTLKLPPLCGQMCPHYDGPLPTARLRGSVAGWKPALRVGQPRSSRSPACAGMTLARLATLLLLPNTVLTLKL